jgi:hypothetical protein
MSITLSHDLDLAAFTIKQDYGDDIAFTNAEGSLLKFGRNENIGTGSVDTVWQVEGNETFVTTNVIDTISSSDAGDTSVIRLFGHTVTGTGTDAEFTLVSQDVTLSGQSKVTLTTPLARAHRMFVSDSSTLAGDVHLYEDTAITDGVPSDLTKAHLKILAGETQTYKAAYTVSKNEYLMISSIIASVTKKTSAVVDIQLQVREVGGVFKPKVEFSVTQSSGVATVNFLPYIIVPKNADVRVSAVSSSAATQVNASWNSYAAEVLT